MNDRNSKFYEYEMTNERNLTGSVLKMGAFHFGQRNPKLTHFNGNHNSTLKNLPISLSLIL